MLRPLDCKFGSALMNTLGTDPELGPELALKSEEREKEGVLIFGLELYYHILQWHQQSKCRAQVCHFRHLSKVRRSGQGWKPLQSFVTKFKDTLASMTERPSSDALLTLFEDQVLDSDVLKTHMDQYRDIDEQDSKRNYNYLINVVETQLNKHRVLMNTEAIGVEPKLGLVLQEEKSKKQLRQEKNKLAKEQKLKRKKDTEAKGSNIEQLLMAAVSKLNLKADPKFKEKPKRLTDESYKKCIEQGLCVKFQLGKCTNKDCKIGKHEKAKDLKFVSPAQTPRSSSPSPKGDKEKKPKSETLCKFFKQGSCKKGDDCDFSHSQALLLGSVALIPGVTCLKTKPEHNTSSTAFNGSEETTLLGMIGSALKRVTFGGICWKWVAVASITSGLSKDLAESTAMKRVSMRKLEELPMKDISD